MLRTHGMWRHKRDAHKGRTQEMHTHKRCTHTCVCIPCAHPLCVCIPCVCASLVCVHPMCVCIPCVCASLVCVHPLCVCISCVYPNGSISVYVNAMRMSHVTCECVYIDQSHPVHIPFTGFLKVQVSFAEYSLFYRALLQKRPIIFITHQPHHINHILFASHSQASQNYKSLLQNIVSFIGLFCKRDL